MRRIAPICLLALAAACGSSETPQPATPDVQTRDVTYEQNGTTLKGLLAWDANQAGPRPGVLVVHEWWGHDEHARNQARKLAEAGYVGLALDMYGNGKTAAHPEQAQAFMEEALKTPAVLAARFNAARDFLAQDSHVDPEQLAAIGFCFGGTVALNMARAGADLDAVATFHAALGTETPAQPNQLKAKILVLTGEADPMVPAEAVQAFREEMTAAGADFRIVSYPGAKHSFTNPSADSHGMEQLSYDPASAEASWKEMLSFFERVFG
jgi:dienelactone hydrolase